MIRLPEIIVSLFASSILAACTLMSPPPKSASAIRSVAPERRDADLLIRNVRIVTGTGAVIERGAVVIRGERIERIILGESSETAVQVINGDGIKSANTWKKSLIGCGNCNQPG